MSTARAADTLAPFLPHHVPGKRSTNGNCTGCPSPQFGIEVFWCESKTRSDYSKVIAGQHLSGGDIGNDVERSSKPEIGLFARLALVVHAAEGLPRRAAAFDHVLEFRWLQRESRIGPT